MKPYRTIRSILYAQPMDMGGLPIRQPFPSAKAERPDPFLLLHHANIQVPSHLETRHAGVGPHPHRGFSPVTFIFEGGVHHRDSRGNNNVVYSGGTQWMHAGMGVIHSERPPADIHELGGRQELIQLWVNSPAAHKMDQPSYQPLTAADTPVIKTADGLVQLNIIAGELDGVTGPIQTLTPLNAFTAQIKTGGKYTVTLPAGHQAFIYLLDGKLLVNEADEVSGHYAVIFNQDADTISLEGLENTRLLIASGKPLDEPVVANGPFVMNTETQVMEAFRDYQLGKMGVLIEE